MTPVTDDLLDQGDARWDALVGGDSADPHSRAGAVSATAPGGWRAALATLTGPGWSAAVPFHMRALAGGGALFRSPIYGGPYLEAARAPEAAAPAARDALDRLLRRNGAVSEVTVLSPFLPHVQIVADAWSAVAVRTVRTARLSDMSARWSRMDAARRSEIRRALRNASTSWEPFAGEYVDRFAAHHAAAMAAKDAEDRLRLDADEFHRLSAVAGEQMRVATVTNGECGAMALVLGGGLHASYLYATRWGSTRGESAAALWLAQERLFDEGVADLLLGGGLSDSPDDPLLRFKRDLSDTEVPLFISARVFDRAAHEAAVAHGLVRPLPAASVEVS